MSCCIIRAAKSGSFKHEYFNVTLLEVGTKRIFLKASLMRNTSHRSCGFSTIFLETLAARSGNCSGMSFLEVKCHKNLLPNFTCFSVVAFL